MIDLLNDLADADPWYEDFAVWSYASTAFWWQNQCGIVRVARKIEIGFRFNLDGAASQGRLVAVRRRLSRSRCSGRRSLRITVVARWSGSCGRWQRTGMRSAAMS